MLQGIDYVFVFVGIPVIELSMALLQFSIKYMGMHYEQTTVYVAIVIDYLTRTPGACLVVSDPSLLHVTARIVNSQINCWLVIQCLNNKTIK